ncbi:MAG: HAD-IIA family hydrolase [Firmicutes bacterium]|nr:HAD-IIA family hydrolase [Bacillota bacterium]
MEVNLLKEQEIRERLASIQTYLLDLDGTVYLGDEIFPFSLPFFKRLEELGKKFIFVTNNSSRTGAYYVAKLTRMGVTLRPEQVFTSGEATRLYLKNNYSSRRIYLLGTPDLEEEFCQDGFLLTTENPAAVILGFDQTLNYEKLRIACSLIRQGVPFIATHPDFNCPTPEGPIPDCGAMIAAITAATGVQPTVIGKPFPAMVEALCVKYGLEREKVAIIGDRLYTDIALGQQAGITSILVLSGETQLVDLEDTPYRPDLVATDLGELSKWLA